MLHNVVILFI